MTNQCSLLTGGIMLFCFTMLLYSCNKPDIKAEKQLMKPMNSTSAVTISIEEIYAQLPQTIMHNVATRININMTKAEWIYESEYLMVRIPLNNALNKSYLYAVKPYNNPTGTVRVFMSQYLPEDHSEPGKGDYSGRQVWLNFQDWKIYGVQYQHNAPVAYLNPVSINPSWESRMLSSGLLYLNNGSIAVNNNPPNSVPDPPSITMIGDEMMGNGKGQSFWEWLSGGISDIIGGIGDFFGGDGNGNPGSGNPSGNGGSWGPPPSNDPGGYGGGQCPPPPSNNGTGGGGSTPSEEPPVPPIVIWDLDPEWRQWVTLDAIGENHIPIYLRDHEIGNSSGVFVIDNPTITYLRNTLGLDQVQVSWLLLHLDMASSIKTFLITYVPDLTQQQKIDIARDHLKMMMENTDYLNRINNLTGNWWDQDQNGMIAARKIQMEFYLQANPEGMLDCNELATLPMAMYQDVGSYQVPQSVINRINTIRNNNPNFYTANNFKIKPIQSATGGIVNCDYFYIKINSLPYINNIQMSSFQFLEYFRTHINDFINLPINTNVSFEPYHHYVAGSIDVNDAPIFNSSYQNSLGSLIHIDMINNGSVVESGYDINTVTNHASFTFTTMITPLDGQHPVSGNRRFGIFQSGGSYYFYILGVDRTNDFFTTLINISGNSAFDGADELWRGIQTGILDFYDTHQGDAVNAQERIVRPKWNITKDFLLGHKTLSQMKTELNCP